MKKRSVMIQILVVVAIAMVLPALLSAQAPVCEPPYCDYCPANTYDCTTWWAYSSWSNLQTCLALMWAGYNVTVCCN